MRLDGWHLRNITRAATTAKQRRAGADNETFSLVLNFNVYKEIKKQPAIVLLFDYCICFVLNYAFCYFIIFCSLPPLRFASYSFSYSFSCAFLPPVIWIVYALCVSFPLGCGWDVHVQAAPPKYSLPYVERAKLRPHWDTIKLNI